MIEVKNLTKHYGSKKALDDISFTVNDGEILGFLGPNGAGKSTTMNILTGYISATDGEVLINGIDILDAPPAAKKEIFPCIRKSRQNSRQIPRSFMPVPSLHLGQE